MTTSGVISQVEVEVLKYAEPSTAYISQNVVEALKYGETSSTVLSQLAVEILYTQVSAPVTVTRAYKLLPTIN